MPVSKKYCIIRQHDRSDCGVVCLLSLIKFYGGDGSLEQLRKQSGTSRQGTSLLGLHQAAQSSGFDAEGCEADFPSLIEHGHPMILHVLMEGNMEHYVVCYAYEQGRFVIGDPGKGMVSLTEKELDGIWRSRTCLILTPNEKFKTKAKTSSEKRKWMLNLISEDIGLLGVSVGLGLGIAVLGMSMAIFSQKLIDDIIPSKLYSKLWTGVALLSVLLFARLGLLAIRQFLLLTQSRQFNNRIIRFFYGRLLNLPKSFFDTRKIGELTARLNDTRRIQTVISQVLGNIIIDALVVLVSLGFLFVYSWQVALLVLLSIPLFFLLIYRNNTPIIKAQREVMAGYALSESNFVSTMQGIATIKNNNKQKVFQMLNQHIYGIFQDRVFGLGKINIRLGLLSGVIGAAILVAVLALGSVFVLREQLQLGELMAILTIGGSLLPSVANLALVSIPINEAKVAFDRMFEFAGMEHEITGTEYAASAIQKVELSGISFRYPGRKRLLDKINLDLNRGKITAIAGESGCGKSTLCQILQKFYYVEKGQILVDGVSLHSIDTNEWRNKIGVVPQESFIFNGTVLDNIAIGALQEEIPQIIEFCRETGFHRFIETLPQSYGTIVGEEGINLSGGQKQLVDWIRVLYRRPQILIVDEGTSSMDSQTEQFVFELLSKQKHNIAILFITHRLHLLRKWCDYIYILDNAKITDHGTHHELVRKTNLYQNYWLAIDNNYPI
ncbi:MAG: peptidase domain-containing ABC transporter [Bacteroidales bacterium]|jgi:ATP-binding cassette subfamily B protein|nr:peptidase domain-containing ABC transporter [Bacteroidales bacterium]